MAPRLELHPLGIARQRPLNDAALGAEDLADDPEELGATAYTSQRQRKCGPTVRSGRPAIPLIHNQRTGGPNVETISMAGRKARASAAAPDTKTARPAASPCSTEEPPHLRALNAMCHNETARSHTPHRRSRT